MNIFEFDDINSFLKRFKGRESFLDIPNVWYTCNDRWGWKVYCFVAFEIFKFWRIEVYAIIIEREIVMDLLLLLLLLFLLLLLLLLLLLP